MIQWTSIVPGGARSGIGIATSKAKRNRIRGEDQKSMIYLLTTYLEQERVWGL